MMYVIYFIKIITIAQKQKENIFQTILTILEKIGKIDLFKMFFFMFSHALPNG